MAWLGTWAYRFEITIDSTKIDGALTDFPLMVHLSSSCGTNTFDATPIFDELGANKLKIAATQSDGTTQMYVEVEYWDDTGEEAFLHIKVPSIASGSDTVIYLYYDSTEADNTTYVGDVASATAVNVWDSNFTHVYHLSESGNGTTDEYKNSAASDHGTGGASKYPDRISAKVGYGQQFGSESDGEYILCDGADPDGNTEITFEAVFKPASGELSGHKTLVMNPGGNINGCFYLDHGANIETFIYTTGGYDIVTGATSLSAATWYYGAGKWKSGEKIRVWLDDDQDAEASSARTGTIDRGIADSFEIGNWHQVASREFVSGEIDEVRISDIRRTDEWNKATYYTLFDDLISFVAESDLERDLTDQIGLDDSADAFNLTDEISDGVGLADTIDAYNQMSYSTDQIGLQDQILPTMESQISTYSDGIGLSDFIDASIFPGRFTDTIGLQDLIQGGFEFPVDLSDGIGIADVIDGLNWTEWLALYGDRAIKRYLFTLTGDADSTTDIEIPISNFQARKRTGYDTYLSVTIPNLSYSAQIEARSNGDMVLNMAFEINGEIEFEQEFIRATLDRIDIYEGSKNRSIVLIGYKTQTFNNQIAIVQHPIYKSSMGGRLLYRFGNLDPYVNPGDTCQVESDEFTVDYVNYQVSERYSVMEIKEI